MNRHHRIFYVVVAAALVSSGCDLEGLDSGRRFKEDFSLTADLPQGGRVAVESFNGAVEVRGWDQGKVEIRGTKYANSEERLKEIKVEAAPSGSILNIRAIRPADRRGSAGVSFVINVPRTAPLDRVVTSNGPISVEALESGTRLTTSNGPVRVARVNGDTEVDTSNAPIELSDFKGAAHLVTSNGPVSGSGIRGRLHVVTSNAPVDLKISELQPGEPAKISTSNGPVALEFASFSGTDLSVATSNGHIEVRVPASIAARLKAKTSNASVHSDIDLTNVASKGKSLLEGTLGAGGPLLDLHTSNGSIDIRRVH